MDAVFIQQPQFKIHIDHRKNAPVPSQALHNRTKSTAQVALGYVRLFFSSLKDSARYTLVYAILATRIAILTVGHPVSAVIRWVMCMAIGFVVVAIPVFLHKLWQANQKKSKQSNVPPPPSNTRLDLGHLQKKIHVKIDMKGVPLSLTVSSLKTLFKDIPIYYSQDDSNANKVGAIRTRSSRVDLEKGLDTIIARIADQAPWVGAPSPRDRTAVYQFYSKMNDLIRYSLHKVISEYDDFIKEQGGVPEKPDATTASKEEKAIYQKYVDLAENRSRFVIDLAIAGTTCAGGVMGEALEMYSLFSAESQGTQGSLEDIMLHTLAYDRINHTKAAIRDYILELPRACNPRHPQPGEMEYEITQTRHYLSACMAQLGSVLSLPGSEGVTEQITKIQEDKVLQKFFNHYTPKAMTAALVEKYKNCQYFRTLVQTWLKKEVGTWNQQKYDQITVDLKPQINSVLIDTQIENATQTTLTNLLAILNSQKDEFAQRITEKGGKIWFDTLQTDENGDPVEQELHTVPIQDVMQLLKNSVDIRNWVISQLSGAEKDSLKKREDQTAKLSDLVNYLKNKNDLPEKIVQAKTLKESLAKLITSPTAMKWAAQQMVALQIPLEAKDPAGIKQKQIRFLQDWAANFIDHEGMFGVLHQQLINQIVNGAAPTAQKQITSVRQKMTTEAWISKMECPELVTVLGDITLGRTVQQKSLQAKLVAKQRVVQINQLFQKKQVGSLHQHQIDRLIDIIMSGNSRELHNLVESHLNDAREVEFFMALMGSQAAEGTQVIKEELMEWLLVSHRFLKY